MRIARLFPALTLLLTLWGSLYGWQQRYGFQRRSMAYESEMQNPAEDPPDAYEDTEFAASPESTPARSRRSSTSTATRSSTGPGFTRSRSATGR